MKLKPATINYELLKLKVYLQQHPKQAQELALAHYSDCLILISEYDSLENELNQLKKSNLNSKLISASNFSSATLTLEQEFRVVLFREHLKQYPQSAEFWAIVYFHNYLILAKQYQNLETEFLSWVSQKSIA